MKFEDFRRLPFLLPPAEEQRTIAAFLDYETARIDKLIAQQQRLIELLKEKRQAVISHAVTKGLNPDAPMKDSGVEWLGKCRSIGWYRL
jgi:type I restriction enzyme S subunit